jgi:Holliday junction DNA helicase RuvB
LLRRVRDYAEVKTGGMVTTSLAEEALTALKVDHRGLDATDRRLLTTIIERFGGGPVGVNSVAAAIQEDEETIEDVYEPYLIKAGFLERTPRGRMVTRLGYEHLGINVPSRLL